MNDDSDEEQHKEKNDKKSIEQYEGYTDSQYYKNQDLSAQSINLYKYQSNSHS